MSSLQFTTIKIAIKQLSGVDLLPYQECIRRSPYGLKMLDATLLVCIETEPERVAYIEAALKKAGMTAKTSSAFVDCYQRALTTPEFSVMLSSPEGTGSAADEWAIGQFTAASLTCSR